MLVFVMGNVLPLLIHHRPGSGLHPSRLRSTDGRVPFRSLPCPQSDGHQTLGRDEHRQSRPIPYPVLQRFGVRNLHAAGALAKKHLFVRVPSIAHSPSSFVRPFLVWYLCAGRPARMLVRSAPVIQAAQPRRSRVAHEARHLHHHLALAAQAHRLRHPVHVLRHEADRVGVAQIRELAQNGLV